MHFSKILGVMVFALAGCDVALVPQSSPTPSTATPTSVAAPAPVAQIPRDQRAMARAFVEVVNRLEPVAERECRHRHNHDLKGD